MKAPSDQAKANDEVPLYIDTFDGPANLVEGERTRDNFLSVALQLREPTTFAEIAE